MKAIEKPEDAPRGSCWLLVEFQTVTESSGWGPEADCQISCPKLYAFDDREQLNQHLMFADLKRCVVFAVSDKAEIKRRVEIA